VLLLQVLLLCRKLALAFVCVFLHALCGCNGGAVGCCIKSFEALQGHLLACRKAATARKRRQQQRPALSVLLDTEEG
jgi:hypothetical protein